MKRLFISDIEPGMNIDEVFFLRRADERITRNGNSYFSLRLSDRSGTMDARLWRAVDEHRGLLGGDSFIRVKGRAGLFRGRLQINVDKVERARDDRLRQRDFIAASYRDIDELKGYIDYFLTEIYDSDYLRLLESFFHDAAFMDRFSRAPGDSRSHHAYLGGLLEHTISVATLSQHTVVQHPRLNGDLLITAALLHDIGKIEELTFKGRIKYSREGKLLGHVLLGQRMIEGRVQKIGDFPKEKELQLIHALISHHGELEWGAPKRPQSAEALVLHHLDNMDAKVKGFLEIVEGSGEVSWPEMQNLFRRPLTVPKAADRDEM